MLYQVSLKCRYIEIRRVLIHSAHIRSDPVIKVDSVDLVTFDRLLLIILPKKVVLIFNEECLLDSDFDITSLYGSSYINNSGREFTSWNRVFSCPTWII
jgi:hypothetical protein